MNFFKISLLITILSLTIGPDFSQAQSIETSLLGLGTGVAGILDAHKRVLGSLEYRPHVQWGFIRPWVGLDAGYDLVYVAGGVLTHLKLKENLFLTPSFGMGLYSSHQGIKLGSPLEFKSTLELNFRLKDQNYLGVGFSHLSNGGLDDKNPGAEILKICYYMPL